jgi:hypothetical protein
MRGSGGGMGARSVRGEKWLAGSLGVKVEGSIGGGVMSFAARLPGCVSGYSFHVIATKLDEYRMAA